MDGSNPTGLRIQHQKEFTAPQKRCTEAGPGSGLLPGYTQRRCPLHLVWHQEFAERDEAFAAERQIKGWSRPKKEALIRGDWEAVQLLSRKLFLWPSFDTPPLAATQDERK